MVALILGVGAVSAADPVPQPQHLWPQGAPDKNGLEGPEVVKACIGNISIPIITVDAAPKETATGVPVENSLRFYQALIAHKVPAACLIFEAGGHGPGAFHKNPSWEVALDAWLKKRRSGEA
jgi:hypothetical protein